jgi:hypothetical protein
MLFRNVGTYYETHKALQPNTRLHTFQSQRTNSLRSTNTGPIASRPTVVRVGSISRLQPDSRWSLTVSTVEIALQKQASNH